MTGRDRLLSAFSHERVPFAIDFCGTPSSGIHVDAYARLCAALGWKERPCVFDLLQWIALPSPEMRTAMRTDVALLPRRAPRFGIPLEGWKSWRTFDDTDCLVPMGFMPETEADGAHVLYDADRRVMARMPWGGRYYDFVDTPHARHLEAETLEGVAFPVMGTQEADGLRTRAEALRREGYAVVGAFGGSVFEASQRAFGYQNFMEALLLQQEYLQAYFELLCDGYLRGLDVYLSRLGDVVDVIQMSDDLGAQSALLLSPALYRRMLKPFHARIYGYVHEKCPDMKVLLHCCGAIEPLIGDLIEIGVDALNPVQISAAGMAPALLKQRYGRHLVFWGGGADMQQTVRLGDIVQIRREVRELCDVFGEGGGFVFAPVHNIQAGVTPEQILAIYQTAWEAREA